MKTIWKFELPLASTPVVEMPSGAVVLSTAILNDGLVVWALVDSDAPVVNHLFAIQGTGFDVQPAVEQGSFIGTVQTHALYPLVWHIFSLGDIDD